ncbi:MAG: undecaprenyl-diphosphatase UppP [Candidatus Marinimicrobia bacterium]|jgi:undecaprenyl-diphosphatase|nr:undecaprenyl-diphosphatase UppP [Candidatus Neomarinimicrobiota bacterium]MBT3630595.1 undecaprenyl-diphosphatase UppP [Candidatus Neomarinimicrobiota bacterium]MBT3825310.1 undecaprenyl-diphosphatase UppP [Candidatus Neomarinimicrobiota bacterium]MBT4129462.1 undecaprenyl-diphosphatase UppP [Candidatus Neomarinimicrobiota bacterium]MBT4295745.1 undecaprenyl-diphosphatase UppP [Candidatus Neomarinimicrobiota bacterium]
MSPLSAAILAIVQGLTEFLPVSSSGHLVLGEALLNSHSFGDSIAFELVVHLGTFLAVLVIFWKDILNLFGIFATRLIKPGNWSSEYKHNDEFRLTILMLLAMLPAGIVGLLLRDQISDLFSQPFMVSIALLFTGSMLLATKYFPKSDKPITIKRALFIGFAQALALVPGISRSGSTISMALGLGIKQEQAARFSFIMVLPLIMAATVLEFIDLLKVGLSSGDIVILLIGLVVSFIVGIFSLKWLLKLLRNGKFHYFAWYCFSVAIIGLFFF